MLLKRVLLRYAPDLLLLELRKRWYPRALLRYHPPEAPVLQAIIGLGTTAELLRDRVAERGLLAETRA
jgi:hypothetical protein